MIRAFCIKSPISATRICTENLNLILNTLFHAHDDCLLVRFGGPFLSVFVKHHYRSFASIKLPISTPFYLVWLSNLVDRSNTVRWVLCRKTSTTILLLTSTRSSSWIYRYLWKSVRRRPLIIALVHEIDNDFCYANLLYVENGLLLLPYHGSFNESPALPSYPSISNL